MIEIKFLKELPVRSLNSNTSFVALTGGDIYVDKDNNRYAYLSFEVKTRKPMLSLYYVVKEYDGNGTMIRENKQCNPVLFAKQGNFVIERPIKIAQDCDALDVYIGFAEFYNFDFYDDAFHKKGNNKLEDYIPENKLHAPVVNRTLLEGGFVAPNAAEQKVEETKPEEKVEEKPFEAGPREAAPEAGLTPPFGPEAPAAEVPAEENIKGDETGATPVVEEKKEEQLVGGKKVYSVGMKFNPAALIALAIAFAIIMVVFNFALTFIN